jgi:hypothetical protein
MGGSMGNGELASILRKIAEKTGEMEIVFKKAKELA